jgi:hypothetical protein
MTTERMRIVTAGGRTVYASSGYDGGKHAVAGIVVCLIFVGVGIALVWGAIHTSGADRHSGFVEIIVGATLGSFGAIPLLIGLLIAFALVAQWTSARACWVDGAELHLNWSRAGRKRAEVFTRDRLTGIDYQMCSRVGEDSLYRVLVHLVPESGEATLRDRRSALEAIGKDEAETCVGALRAALGLDDQVPRERPSAASTFKAELHKKSAE